MRPNNSTKVLIAVGAVATLSLGVAFLTKEGDSGLPSEERSSDASSDSAAKKSGDSGTRFLSGRLSKEKLVMLGSYELDYSTKVASGGHPMLQVHLEGTTKIVPVEGVNDVYRLDFSGTPRAYTGQNPVPGFISEMQRSIYLEVLPEGRYQIKGERQLSEVARKTWMMVGDFILARPSSEPGRESGALGRCDVRYSADSPTELVRERLRCSTEVGVEIDAIKDLSSKQAFELDRQGLISASTLVESLRTSGKNIPEFDVQTRIAAKRTSTDVVVASASSYASAGVLRRDEVSIRREMDAQRIGGRTYKGTLAKFLTHALKGPDHRPTKDEEAEMARDFVALAAILRTDPEAAKMAIEHVQQDGPLTNVLLDALRDAGTPEAQSALIGVANDDGRNPEHRYAAVRNLSALGHPTGETVDFLLNSKKDPVVGEQVTYSAGAVASNVRSADPAVAGKLVDSLVNQLKESPGLYETEATLKALGNAGGAEILPEVEQALKSDSARTRAAAVSAIRRVESKNADDAILAALSDENQYVRFAAAKALGDRRATDDAVAVIAQRLLVEEDFRVLSQEVYLAGKWLGDGREALRAPLAKLAESATDESVRTRAKRLLERYPV